MNWPIKIKSNETDYTINYWIDYTNEKRQANRGSLKPALECFYSFYFSVKNGGSDTITEKCIYAYNLMNVTCIYLSESCKKSNDVSAEKIQRFASVQSTLTIKQDLSLSWNMFACMYVFICHRKKSFKTAHSLIFQSIKLSN